MIGPEKEMASSSRGAMTTQVLPSDVELVAAKKQQEAAYNNSYIGQVLIPFAFRQFNTNCYNLEVDQFFMESLQKISVWHHAFL